MTTRVHTSLGSRGRAGLGGVSVAPPPIASSVAPWPMAETGSPLDELSA
jgi:hypothetical protein